MQINPQNQNVFINDVKKGASTGAFVGFAIPTLTICVLKIGATYQAFSQKNSNPSFDFRWFLTMVKLKPIQTARLFTISTLAGTSVGIGLGTGTAALKRVKKFF